MFEHHHNMARIPSQSCTRECKKPCPDHSIDCLQVLGSTASVKNVASSWASNSKEFMIMRSYLQDVYASTAQFTPNEYDAYREALNDVITFMQKCLEETKLASLE